MKNLLLLNSPESQELKTIDFGIAEIQCLINRDHILVIFIIWHLKYYQVKLIEFLPLLIFGYLELFFIKCYLVKYYLTVNLNKILFVIFQQSTRILTQQSK
ncbi:unnamed protein product [Paramecium sonneborni]|uniref:Uncharacterized protein n=1 Tax=Paramecium sonneborni TaxID=65129 RepID=A0A8S1RGI5_9CILI|nr:unnamed protein product [Paramecium sonneborni]